MISRNVPEITLLLLALCAPVSAAQYVVDGGNPLAADSNTGTAASPFKTVGKAAKIARAGDVILIERGIYRETITVANSGTADAPIVFQSAQWHGAVLTNTAPEQKGLLFKSAQEKDKWTSFYVTLRGLTFGESAPNPYGMSVLTAHGWHVEDCLFQRNDGLLMRNEAGDANDVTVLRCVFEDCWANSLVGSGGLPGDGSDHLKNLTIRDTIFRRSNSTNTSPGGEVGANKILWSDNTVLDGVISYDNNGSGTWIDYNNTNYTVRNCTFFGNHAGFGMEKDGKAYDQHWAAVGLWSEANQGPGLVENNVFYSNLASAFGDLDSGSVQPIIVRNNTFVDNGSSVEFRGMDDHASRRLGKAEVTQNLFKSWHDLNWKTTVEQNIPVNRPIDMGIVIDHNTYDPAPEYTAGWASWRATTAKDSTYATGLSEIKDKFGEEEHGQIAPIAFRGQTFPVFFYPTEAEAKHPDPVKLRQVPSQAAEQLTIDAQIAHAKSGTTVTIPVFGRKSLISARRGWETEVYDLQGRYVHLTGDGKSRKKLEEAVTSYAIIDPAYLKIKLTRVEPYAVEGRFVSVGSPDK